MWLFIEDSDLIHLREECDITVRFAIQDIALGLKQIGG